MKDKDGFHILARKETIGLKAAPKDKKKDKKIHTGEKNPFKKGTWKHQFWKNLKKYLPTKAVQFFHNINYRNFVVYRDQEDSDYEVIVRNKHLSNGEVALLRKADKADILISVGDQMYARVSPKAYQKLQKVDKIAIHFRLDGWFDGEDEVMTIMEDYSTITDINSLLSYINYHRQGVYGVYETQAKCCGYTDFAFKFKILVTFRGGKCKVYKGDMNDFLKDFDLYQF